MMAGRCDNADLLVVEWPLGPGASRRSLSGEEEVTDGVVRAVVETALVVLAAQDGKRLSDSGGGSTVTHGVPDGVSSA
jgi:hypothetical protein